MALCNERNKDLERKSANEKPVIAVMETSIGAKMIEAQYQTVSVKEMREKLGTSTAGVEEILKKIAPPKSFLYRNQQQNKLEKTERQASSYVPMVATPKKEKKFLRIGSFEYPSIDLKQFRFSKIETEIEHNDRGYYSIRRSSRQFFEKTFKTESRKCKSVSISTPEDLSISNEKYQDDHFYEDLYYTDPTKEIIKNVEPENTTNMTQNKAKKFSKLLQTIKLPFMKKNDMVEVDVDEEGSFEEIELPKPLQSVVHIYENSDNIQLYDTVPVRRKCDDSEVHKSQIPVEEYLEPVRLSRDYCDVAERRDDSLLGIIMAMIETTFRRRGESAEVINSEDSTDHDDFSQKPQEKTKETQDKTKTNMADRPLPVPVENETYYMDIDRSEAENLLRGTPDGTFVLRPSSQPDHAYTLTVSCSNSVYNIGIRRRPDGHLALGFARKCERSFHSIASLLRHHRKKRLLLVIGGNVCGATTLNDTPQYYQTPTSMPVKWEGV